MAKAPQKKQERPAYLDSLRGFDPNRDFAKYAQPVEPQDPAISYEYAQRNSEYINQLNERLGRPPEPYAKDSTTPNIQLMQSLYDQLEAGGDTLIDQQGARAILANELYKAQMDYERRKREAQGNGISGVLNAPFGR